MMNLGYLLLLCIFVLFGLPASAQEDFRLYRIGNSLTVDTRLETLKYTLMNGGMPVTQGRHIACSRSLTEIVADPDYTCEPSDAPYGKWQQALADFEWDAITLQAYTGSTAINEINATKTLINAALTDGRNQNCIFYLYFAWPMASETENFYDRVMVPFGGGDDDPVFLSSGFLDYWYNAITSEFPTLDIRVIPTGIAFAHLDQKLREISVASFTDTHSLYRDVHHMNIEEGRHVALASVMTALSGLRPEQHAFFPPYRVAIDRDFANYVDEVIWYTMTSDPRTGVTAPLTFGIAPNNEQEDVMECRFTGSLYRCTDLSAGSWEEVIGATSPFRIQENETAEFFRSQRVESVE